MFENVRHCEKSDIGLLRHNNEDSFLVADQQSNHDDLLRLGMMFVIADGMGGHAAGEIASRLACQEVVSGYCGVDGQFHGQTGPGDLYLQKLEETIWSTHRRLVDFAREKEELRGMGTTLSALVLANGKAYMAHVGNSRIYRFRKHSFEKMTVDHTQRQALIDAGQIHPEDEINHYYGRIITQALGGYADLATVFTRSEDVQRGDRFLLCTDGLHDLVTDSDIQNILRGNPSPRTACGELIQAAIQRGGSDNVTVIVVQV